MSISGRAILLLLLAATINAAPSQVPLRQSGSQYDIISQPPSDNYLQPRRNLKGRFLHITDMHPDPFYRIGASESSACHRKRPKKEQRRAGYYGVPYGEECDSSFQLTNLTLDHLEKHWSNEIDFVIWTGDSARHDNDRELPRTLNEIYELNRAMVRRMNEIFTDRGIPVVPSLGNNDIWPHNIFSAGPNAITNTFADIWRTFIPFESYQVFQRGAYYSVEVIPDEIAVISLNTLYFYDSNKAVGGCEYTDAQDPGNLELDWLEVQLDRYRDRGMQVWISGHVPPSPGNYFPGCFVRYAETALRFQDTILGHLFGHMNVDHFFFLHTEDLNLPSEERVETAKKDSLVKTLMNDFGMLPKEGKTDLDEYAIINVSPSVVPNPYLPSFRVYAYNVTEVDELVYGEKQQRWKTSSKRNHGHRRSEKGGGQVDCKKKENRDTWECRPKKPYHAHAESPSRMNQLWSPLGYAQYWLPDVGVGNSSVRPRFELEYLTYSLPSLHAGTFEPVPERELPKSLRRIEGNRDIEEGSKYAPYGLLDLTIGSWIGLGRELGDGRSRELRKTFERLMFMR